MNITGIVFDSLAPLPAKGVKLIREMGVTVAKYPLPLTPLNSQGTAVWPSPRVYNWSRVAQDLDTLENAGFQVMVTPMWLPRWVTGGLPINEPFESVDWQHGNVETGEWREFTKEEKPWLFEPNRPSISSSANYDFGAALGAKFGPRITYIADWNEAGIGVFYPQKESSRGYLEAMRKPLYEDIWFPFMSGYQSVWKGSQVVGPDAESPGTLNLFLQLEDPRIPYDILSFHCYGIAKPPTLEDSAYDIGRVGGYADVLRRHNRLNRPGIWNTEFVARDGPKPLDWLQMIHQQFPWIDGNFFYSPARFVEGGSTAWDSGKFVPNNDYWEVQEYLLYPSTPPRRRAVRS